MIYQDKLTHISLFSGIGGDTLAAEWAGFKTVLFVENDKFCQKVLNKHWSDVPLLEDIKDVTKETIANSLQRGEWAPKTQRQVEEIQGDRPCNSSDTRRDRRTNTVSPITLITGGFPCQPFSVAGQQRGKEDDRYLWPEMLRVIKEVRPIWVVAENVAGLIRMGIDDCISDLENIGYTTEPYLIPACAVNAPHRRDRVFIVAHTNISRDTQSRLQQSGVFTEPGQDVADTSQQGLQGQCGNTLRQKERWDSYSGYFGKSNSCSRGAYQWAVEPDVGRVAHGIPSRVDRLKALGNAIVPQQIYPILKAIAGREVKT